MNICNWQTMPITYIFLLNRGGVSALKPSSDLLNQAKKQVIEYATNINIKDSMVDIDLAKKQIVFCNDQLEYIQHENVLGTSEVSDLEKAIKDLENEDKCTESALICIKTAIEGMQQCITFYANLLVPLLNNEIESVQRQIDVQINKSRL